MVSEAFWCSFLYILTVLHSRVFSHPVLILFHLYRESYLLVKAECTILHEGHFNLVVTTENGLLIEFRPDFTPANTGLQKQAHSRSCCVALFSCVLSEAVLVFLGCLWALSGFCGLVVVQGRGKARRCHGAKQRSGSGPSTAPSTPRSTTTSTGTASRAWTCQSECGFPFQPARTLTHSLFWVSSLSTTSVLNVGLCFCCVSSQVK